MLAHPAVLSFGMTDTSKKGLRSLANKELTAVCFVLDYVNLQFEDAFLTVLVSLYVQVGEVKLEKSDAGYRDMLCERIQQKVVAASDTEGQEVRVSFEDGSVIGVPLTVGEFNGREAVILQLGREIRCVWHGGALL